MEGDRLTPVATPNRPDLKSVPKIDLHRHLEGSLRLETVRQLSEAGEIPLPSDIDLLRSQLTVGAADPRERSYFLGRFANIRKVFQSEEIIRRVSREAVLDAAAENVRYLELHLTPVALAAANGASFERVIEWVWNGVQGAEAASIRVQLVVSVNRHESEVAREVARAALASRDHGVVALDLAGDEGEHPAHPFEGVFGEAKGGGLAITAHAGEWAGPASIRAAAELLGADRISHGVRAMEDKETVLWARDRRLPFAVCLTSNVHTGVVKDFASHPLPAMIQAGLQVSLSTDDPGVSSISLTEEFERALAHLDLSYETLKGLILTGAQAAFLPSREKRDLVEDLQRELGLAPGPVDLP